MDTVRGRKTEVLPFAYREQYDIEEMKSPTHTCGMRNSSFVKSHGIYSFYRCNFCNQVFPVREENYTYGKSRKRINA